MSCTKTLLMFQVLLLLLLGCHPFLYFPTLLLCSFPHIPSLSFIFKFIALLSILSFSFSFLASSSCLSLLASSSCLSLLSCEYFPLFFSYFSALFLLLYLYLYPSLSSPTFLNLSCPSPQSPAYCIFHMSFYSGSSNTPFRSFLTSRFIIHCPVRAKSALKRALREGRSMNKQRRNFL